jgi:hypothetical protein
MTEDKSDQGAKDEIRKGMSEAGKDAAPRTGKKPGTGAGGPDQVARDVRARGGRGHGSRRVLGRGSRQA